MDRMTMDRLWRSPDARKQFEKESGFAPLADDKAEYDQQVEKGHVENYHQRFRAWANGKFAV